MRATSEGGRFVCVTGTLRKLWRRRQPIRGTRVPPRAPRAPHIPRAPRTCGGRPRLFWAGFTNSRAAGHGLLHCRRCLFRCCCSHGAGGAKAEPQVEVKPRWRRLRLQLGVGGPCGCPGRLGGCAQCPSEDAALLPAAQAASAPADRALLPLLSVTALDQTVPGLR